MIFRLALLGLLVVSCSRWHNNADRLKLACGPNADKTKYSYVQIDASRSSKMDAIFLTQGNWQPLPVSTYGCLEIPKTQMPARIAIRDQNSTDGRVMTLDAGPNVNLTSTDLGSESQLSAEQVRMFCPGDPYVTQKRVALQRVAQPSRLLSKPVIRAELYNGQDQRVQEWSLPHDASSLDLPASLPEGNYRLKLISQDAFERNAPPFESICQVRLDLTPPIIQSSLDQEAFYDRAQNIRQLAPDEMITFKIEDASETEMSVCLKPYPANCDPEEFMPLRMIRAPAKGLWEIQAYATDKSGQKSPLLRETFAVFQLDKVNNLLTLLSNVNFSLLLGQQPDAMATMKEATKLREHLQLDGERSTIQWPYVDAFWKLDQQVNLLRTLDVKLPIQNLTTSPLSDHFLVQGEEGPAQLWTGDKESTALDRIYSANFGASGGLWTIDHAGQLKLYENKILVRSFPTDIIGMPSVAAGQTNNKVVVWVDQGQETLVRVYDRRSVDDAPLFKVNLPKTRHQKGKYSFFANDRYLIGKNNGKVFIWDTLNDFAERSFTAPQGCVVKDYVVRSDQKIYFVSHAERTPQTGEIPPEKSFCDLQVVDLNANSLMETLASRLTNVTYPIKLALSAEPAQKFLALGRTAGPFMHILNLETQKSDHILKLNDSESSSRIEPISEDRPSFMISTGGRTLLAQQTSLGSPREYFSSTTLGLCEPQQRKQRFLCREWQHNLLRIYSSERDRTILPYVFRSDTQFVTEDLSQYEVKALLEKPLQAFYDKETRSIQLQGEDKKIRASAVLTKELTSLSLHESGRVVFGLEDGTVGILEEGAGLSLDTAGAGTGRILASRMAANQVFALKKKSDDSFVLETRSFRAGAWSGLTSLALPKGPVYSDILYSEKSGRGVVYQKDREAITQEAFLFTQDGKDSGRVPMSMCSLSENRAGSGFHFVRDNSIYFHDFASRQDRLIAASVDYGPCAFLDGEQLYALANVGTSLHAVATGEKLANGTSFAIGPQGTIIALHNEIFKILSADGKTTHVNVRLPTANVNVLSAPDHPDVVLILMELGLGQGVKRLSTNPDVLDHHFRLWGY